MGTKTLDVDQLSRVLRRSESKVLSLHERGKLPVPVSVSPLVWAKDDINRWISEGCPSCRDEAVFGEFRKENKEHSGE